MKNFGAIVKLATGATAVVRGPARKQPYEHDNPLVKLAEGEVRYYCVVTKAKDYHKEGDWTFVDLPA